MYQILVRKELNRPWWWPFGRWQTLQIHTVDSVDFPKIAWAATTAGELANPAITEQARRYLAQTHLH